jgi:putative transposase
MVIGIIPKNRNLSKYFREGGYGLSEEEIWGDLKAEAIAGIKAMIEISMEGEIQELIGRRWEHKPDRITSRNGHYIRGLLTSFGYIGDLKVPRLRRSKKGYKVIKRYQRRMEEVDKMILEMFLAGVSTRRVKEVLEPVLGREVVSSGLVSKISKALDKEVEGYHSRKIEDKYEYLIADGIFLNAKSPVYKKRRCVLVVYGMWREGVKVRREIIDFELACKGESENAWEKFLYKLYYRGLEGKRLKMVTIDGNKGLRNGIELIYPHVKIQRCWAHKLRNMSKKLSRKINKGCIEELKEVYEAGDYNKAVIVYRRWANFWRGIEPEVVKSMEEDIEELLNFYRCEEDIRKKVRTTNIIERVFREVRRRTRPMSCFQNRESVERIVFAVFYRLNNIYKNR